MILSQSWTNVIKTWGTSKALQIRAGAIPKGSAFLFQKVEQVVLQNKVGIKKWGSYYKLRQQNLPGIGNFSLRIPEKLKLC